MPAKKAAARTKRGPGDWRDETLARVRALILEADPEMIEERKWRKPSNGMAGVPVWSHNGIVCTGETYKKRREADVRQGGLAPGPDAALQFQPGRQHAQGDRHSRRGEDRRGRVQGARARRRWPGMSLPAKKAKPGRAVQSRWSLSGGNPQIAKADGDAPVQAFIAAMPGWKRDVGRRLDALIVRTVPERAQGRAVEHALLRHRGPAAGSSASIASRSTSRWRSSAARRCVRSHPVESKQKDVRYLHIYEDDQLDEKLVASWIKQASELPGRRLLLSRVTSGRKVGPNDLARLVLKWVAARRRYKSPTTAGHPLRRTRRWHDNEIVPPASR